MPELPEVETVARELRGFVLNKQIDEIEALWGRSFQNETDVDLSGQTIKSIGRRGKYLIVNLSKTYLIIHLRMTGQVLYIDDIANADLKDYIRVVISLKDRSALLFKDVRKFGRITHVENVENKIAHVGVDALDKRVTQAYFCGLLNKSSMSIKAFLMAQKYVSGMGNIYTDEALFLSKVHPSIPANKISNKNAANLYKNMRSVLQSSIDNMGSSISDYRDPSGNEGTNQNYFFVYGRTGLPCKYCGTDIEKIKFAGRGTHYCPSCQKK
ncbi:MAG: DNA-formamidopyrimidine glycosylase [Calditrichaeota bacterium]|nr:MAG: DNA-formamidopyrimidine glycosylase [Calditrichota bacterium]MBL1204274.1 DNA-formamidopyrimidine glycosylase [Calditrichota bacterium]NOG44104.1 DNA-formamidopyrimidine glycosylase [Calditrichota bacterium]